MQVTFGNMNGEVQLVMVPETHAELRTLLEKHEAEAHCPDCEATIDCDADLCGTCGEGVGCEPEFVKVRKKSA